MTALLRFSRTYLRRYLHWYLGGAVALGLTNWISVTIPLYLAQGIDALARGEAGHQEALNAAGAVALLGLSVVVVRTASRLLFFTPGRLVEAEIKQALFERMLRHQPSFLEQWPTGDLISRLTSDTNMVRLFAGFASLGLINTVVALSLTAGQMIRISPTLAAWTIAPVAVGFVITMAFVYRLHAVMVALQESGAALSDHVLSSYQGIATIQAFRAEGSMAERFEVHNQAWLRAALARAQLRMGIGPALPAAAAVNVFLLLFIGGPMAMEGEISVGELIAFTTLVAYLSGPLRGMSFILSLFRQASVSLSRIEVILRAPPDRPEGPQGAPAPSQPPSLSVRSLSFTYPGAERPSLTDISFHVAAGTTLGVFGPTGSGKTTLLRTLARLYNPPAGAVFVNEVDLLATDLDAWRRAMTLVPQRAFLFSESVGENILLGAEPSALLEEVVDRAALRVDIQSLRDGLDTRVGESGMTLSGGQRQRTALARGLARRSSLLMLDDVLSAVDHTTEAQLIEGLLRLPARPTLIIVANRQSAIQHAELILVLQEGRLVDSGTHDELIARPGLYQEAWRAQSEASP